MSGARERTILMEFGAMTSPKSMPPRSRGPQRAQQRSGWLGPLLIGGLLVIGIALWSVTRPLTSRSADPAQAVGADAHAHATISMSHLHGLSFSANGRQLIVPVVGGTTTPRTLPPLAAQDALSYIALNPTQPEELAVATVARDIYHSRDGGQTWVQIAHAGEGIAAGQRRIAPARKVVAHD